MSLLARSTDPWTSHAAAKASEKFANSHITRIYNALENSSLTAKEIGLITGLTVVQVDRRLPEMQRLGLAKVVTVDEVMLVRDGYRVWARIEPKTA